MEFGLRSMLAAERYQLELYVRSLVDRGLAPATIGRRFGCVRRFYRFAQIDGLIGKDPAANVEVPKVRHDQQYRTWFESVDMAIILRSATDPLDRAVLHLMFDLALRVGELCALNVESIIATTAGPMLRFVGKGNKLAEMLVPGHEAVLCAGDGRGGHQTGEGVGVDGEPLSLTARRVAGTPRHA